MRYIIIDTECTCLKLHPKNLNGNPYSRKNFLCYVGIRTDDGVYKNYPIQYGDEPYGDKLREIQEEIDNHDCLVFFNAKFDLHWLHRYNIQFSNKRIFDTQLCQFILDDQRNPYPSLDDTATRYGLDGKIDVVKQEYWNHGIDTDQIPKEILEEYLQKDVEQTYEVFRHQMEIIPDSKQRLLSLAQQDLVSLFEIEKNGMLYDVETSKAEGNVYQETINELDKELCSITGFPEFNPASGDHISVVLYGGTLTTAYQEVDGVYKTGAKAGQPKLRWREKQRVFPQLVKPLKGSELKKEGFYATNANTLQSLKCTGTAKRIIQLLLKRAELEKLVGTYLHGIPNLITEMDWDEGMVHGNLNQVVAVTGRLSSSSPNLQNFDKEISYLFRSRYGT